MGDFNVSQRTIDKSSRPKMNTGTSGLDDIIDQMDTTDIYRTHHSSTAE